MKPPKSQSLLSRLRLRYAGWQNQQRIARLARQVAAHAQPRQEQAPIVIFNASTRLTGLSLNAAFSSLTAWGLRLGGVPVVHFVCRSGMSPCVLGTNRDNYTNPPPCASCIAQSQRLYREANVRWWTYTPDPALADALENQTIAELSLFEYAFPQAGVAPEEGSAPETIPLGRLVLPSIRWALRRHTLPEDEPTRYLLRQYILSAFRVATEFGALLDEVKPAATLIFNGMMFPEAAACWVARRKGVPAFTHEVGFQRYSAFFTAGEATAYPMRIPPDFELTPEQNAALDANLEQRFQGKFTMAGIQFWPEMRGLDEAFLQRAAGFRQLVPVFTNVIYDTSQAHANVVFENMFAWLDVVLEIIRTHPETFFVIRAHPDEMRPGTKKLSRESVRDWVHNHGVDQLSNVLFIDSQEYVSSYELVQRAKFIMVYNSSIGLEATLLGRPVLCAGKARYTQYPIVFFPPTVSDFRRQAETFLQADGMEAPPEFRRNARRFLYYQLFRVSLPFKAYLQTGPRPGFVQLRPFEWQQLRPENSPTIQKILDGILRNQSFEITQ